MRRTALLAILLTALWAPVAAAQTTAMLGEELAQRWCANCHQIGPSETLRDIPPSFDALANRRENLNWVATYLQDPHLNMEGIDLSRAQIEQITAYLETLQR